MDILSETAFNMLIGGAPPPVPPRPGPRPVPAPRRPVPPRPARPAPPVPYGQPAYGQPAPRPSTNGWDVLKWYIIGFFALVIFILIIVAIFGGKKDDEEDKNKNTLFPDGTFGTATTTAAPTPTRHQFRGDTTSST